MRCESSCTMESIGIHFHGVSLQGKFHNCTPALSQQWYAVFIPHHFLCYYAINLHWLCHCCANDSQIRISTWYLFFNLYLFKLFHRSTPWSARIVTSATSGTKFHSFSPNPLLFNIYLPYKTFLLSLLIEHF